jgi:hypothetical protein
MIRIVAMPLHDLDMLNGAARRFGPFDTRDGSKD